MAYKKEKDLIDKLFGVVLRKEKQTCPFCTIFPRNHSKSCLNQTVFQEKLDKEAAAIKKQVTHNDYTIQCYLPDSIDITSHVNQKQHDIQKCTQDQHFTITRNAIKSGKLYIRHEFNFNITITKNRTVHDLMFPEQEELYSCIDRLQTLNSAIVPKQLLPNHQHSYTTQSMSFDDDTCWFILNFTNQLHNDNFAKNTTFEGSSLLALTEILNGLYKAEFIVHTKSISIPISEPDTLRDSKQPRLSFQNLLKVKETHF